MQIKLRLHLMCHVLIIEDEPLVAIDIEGMLANIGATSFAFAATEDEAVMEASRRRPAVITSDVKLISGTGPCAVQTIRHQMGPIPVLFVTGTPDACNPREERDRVFIKPINRQELAFAFEELLAWAS